MHPPGLETFPERPRKLQEQEGPPQLQGLGARSLTEARGGRDRQPSFSEAGDFRGTQPSPVLKFPLQTPPGWSQGRLQSPPWKSERHVIGLVCAGKHVLLVASEWGHLLAFPNIPSPPGGPWALLQPASPSLHPPLALHLSPSTHHLPRGVWAPETDLRMSRLCL